MARAAPPPWAVLVASGGAWGLTMPLLKLAASAGYPALSLLLWQNLLMAGLAALVFFATRRPWPRWSESGPAMLAIAVLGTVLPGYFTFLTAGELAVGARAIILAMVPICALPIALLLGEERFAGRRIGGLLLGLAAVALLVLPGAGGGPAPPMMVLLAMLGPVSYAVEANVLSRRPPDADPVGLLFGASVISVALTLPLAVATGAATAPRGLGTGEMALLATSPINLVAYVAYVWLAAGAGAVFASQIGYVVTISGVFWGMLLLGERPGPLVWLSLALMLTGIALVRPRKMLET